MFIMMNKTRIFIVFIVLGQTINAQTHLHIHQKDGTCLEVPLEQTDSITFVDSAIDAKETEMAELNGSWLWGNTEQGYYELLTFNEDKTYTGYDNYFTYGFDTTTYGFFTQYGAMLSLWSNGFGYQRRYTWYITGLTSNALSVVTKMGIFTYYKLQPQAIFLKVGETLSNDSDKTYMFTDGTIAQIENNMLIGKTQGASYILTMDNTSQKIWAYKVIVE